MKILLLLTLFVVETLQQEPSLKCKTRDFYRIPINSVKCTCTYANIKSLEDLDKARETASRFPGKEYVSALVFVNSSLSKMPGKMFEGYNSIKVLKGRNLGLEEVSKTAFIDVKSWDTIDLSFNQIRRLEERTFSSRRIKHLDLSQNIIEAIDDTTFTGAKIQILDLAFNKMKSLQFLGAFTTFLKVNMNDNLIDTFDLQVKKDIFKAHVNILDEAEYPELFLQNNRFTTFECSSNIGIFFIALQNNPRLISVSLKECELDEIDLSNCKNLRKVSLNDNLQDFIARNVNINDADFSQAKSLETLSLANSSVSPGVLENILKMSKLMSLDLSYVPIGPLNVSTFAKLKSLQILVLKATNISNIQFDTFLHQRSVEEFDISENNLRYFDMSMIFSMSNLSLLNLAGNNLTSLKTYELALFYFKRLQKVDLSNNKLACDYLSRLVNAFEWKHIVLKRSSIKNEETNTNGVECVNDTKMRKKLNTSFEKTESTLKLL